MSSASMSKGFLKVQKNLFRAIRFARFQPLQRRIAMEGLERQYGWLKKDEPAKPFPLSPTALSALFGCSRLAVRTAVKSMCSAGVLTVVKAQAGNEPGLFLINKEWDQWTCGFTASPADIPWTPRTGEHDPRAVVSAVTTAVASVVTTTPVSTVTTTTLYDAATSVLSEALRDRGETEGDTSTPKPPRGPGVSSKGMDELIAHYRAEWVRWSGKKTRRDMSAMADLARPRLKKYGLDACKLVVSWAFLAPGSSNLRGDNDKKKVYLSGRTLWRPSNFAGYLLEAQSWDADDAPSFAPAPIIPKGQSDYADLMGKKVWRDTDGTWRPNSRKMLDPSLPWHGPIKETMAAILRRIDSGERVDKYVPAPFLDALANCSHPAKPEQAQHLSNILGRVVDEIKDGGQ